MIYPDSEQLQYLIFRAMVAATLEAAGYTGDAWAFSKDLDMSFAEIQKHPFSDWQTILDHDLIHYQIDCPEEFEPH